MAIGTDFAFPVVGEPRMGCDGLNKRELFAAMAMQGLSANPDLIHWSHEELAEHAREAADTLLVELAKSR
jgi:hypothetical protein